MNIKTKKIVESIVSESMSKFIKEQMCEQTEKVNTQIRNDIIIVRLKDVLPPSERQLAKAREGVELVKELKVKLMEEIMPNLKVMIKTLTNAKVVEIYSDISFTTGERIVVFTLNIDL